MDKMYQKKLKKELGPHYLSPGKNLDRDLNKIIPFYDVVRNYFLRNYRDNIKPLFSKKKSLDDSLK